MILNITTEISEYLKTNIPGINCVKRYKNEFEENGNWTAEFPCILWRLQSLNATGFFSNGEIAKKEMQLKLYIGDRKSDEASVLSLIEKVCDKLNGIYLTSYDFRILVRTGKIDFHMYNNGVEVYMLETTIEYWEE